MEQLYHSMILQPALSRRYKTFVHHLVGANASFKVSHELIPYFIEFEGIDFFFRNKIEDSYMCAIGYLENAQAVLEEIRATYGSDSRNKYLYSRLTAINDVIREIIADTRSLVHTFYTHLGTDVQLTDISALRARFSEVICSSIELTSEVK